VIVNAPLLVPRVIGLCVLVAIAASAATASTASAVTRLPCTIRSKAGVAVVRGTAGPDVICVGAGQHVVYALGGDDVVYDGAGADQIHGGAGDDTVYAGGGADVVDGGAGADQLHGGDGVDTLSGDAGNDTIVGADGTDQLSGGLGNDDLQGNGANDSLNGGDGNDQLDGGTGNDSLLGGTGNDQLDGGPGDDSLDGGSGTNTCTSGGGSDQMAMDCDSTAPQLLALAVSQTSYDTSTEPVTLTFTAHITDNLSGLHDMFVGGGGAVVSFSADNRISGDALDGVYQTSTTIPQYTPPGTSDLQVTMQDNVGNYLTLHAADLAAMSFPAQLTQTGPGDVSPPVVSNLGLSETSVDTSGAPVTIWLTVHVSDDMSGLNGSQFNLIGPEGQVIIADTDTSFRTAGDVFSGDYQIPVTLPRYAAQGTWTIQLVFVVDRAGNSQRWQGTDITQLSTGPISVEQTGPGDTTAPQFASTTFTLNGSDPSQGAIPVVATFDLTDDLSGVSSGDCELRNGQTSISFSFQGANQIAGTTQNGEWQQHGTIPQYAPTGTWAVDCYAWDAAGNYGTYHTTINIP
jgi:hypothetical protein